MEDTMHTDVPLLLIESFYGGSHKQFIDFFNKSFPSDLFTLAARKWHWKARCSALSFSYLIPKTHNYRTLLTSSTLNLAELIALRTDLRDIYKVVYFHENQLIYPLRQSKGDRDFQYGYNQILTALTADRLIFNSHFNLNSFMSNIDRFLKKCPDANFNTDAIKETIRIKATVLPFPLEFDFVCSYCKRRQENLSNVSETKIHRTHFTENEVTFISKRKKMPTLDFLKFISDILSSNLNTKTINLINTMQNHYYVNISLHYEVYETLNWFDFTCAYHTLTKYVTHTALLNEFGRFSFSTVLFLWKYKISFYFFKAKSHLSASIFFKWLPYAKLISRELNKVLSKCVIWNLLFNLFSYAGLYRSLVTYENIVRRQFVQREIKTTQLKILWPHRWEHDKDPQTFIETIRRLSSKVENFKLIIVGETKKRIDETTIFDYEEFKHITFHCGYCQNREDYLKLLKMSDVVVSTALHEFFGVAVLEAAYMGCFPLLPNRLVYPELYPPECLYDTPRQLYRKLKKLCRYKNVPTIDKCLCKYRWKTLSKVYARELKL